MMTIFLFSFENDGSHKAESEVDLQAAEWNRAWEALPSDAEVPSSY